jgi:hypothetical protein
MPSVTIYTAGHDHDNNVEYFGLGHNSHDTLYRVPFGSVTPGTEVTLRFRTYHHDVTNVTTRFYNTTVAAESFQEMELVAEDVYLLRRSPAGRKLLVKQANKRGIRIILDGVFNHVSSDSAYFDRYGHFSTLGACESLDSPYRDWFFFTDVAPGSDVCVGSDGSPDSANYNAWFGFDSLPVLDKNHEDVQNLVYAADNAVARYWLDLGGSDGTMLVNDTVLNWRNVVQQSINSHQVLTSTLPRVEPHRLLFTDY